MDSTKLPAHNRLMKLKQKLKESKKISSSNKNSNSRLGGPSTSINTDKYPLKENENNNKLPQGAKLSSKISATNSKASQAQKKKDQAKSSSQPSAMAKSKVSSENKMKPERVTTKISGKRESSGLSESPPAKQATPTVAPNKNLPKRNIKNIIKAALKNKTKALKEILNMPSTSKDRNNSPMAPKPSSQNKLVDNEKSPLNKFSGNKKLSLSNKLNSSGKSQNKSLVTEIQQRNSFKRKKPECIKIPNIPVKDTKKINNSNYSENENILRLSKKKNSFNDNENFSLKDICSSKQQKLGRIQKIPLKQSIHMTSNPDPILTKTRSVEKIIEANHCLNEVSFDDSMEWEPNKKEILRFARSESHECEERMDWEEIISDASANNSFGTSNEEKTVFFVIDTNVLIQSMFLIEKLSNLPDLRGFKAMVMIPWQVLKELDRLKTNMDKTVSSCARKATRFLSTNLSHGSNLVFQNQSLHLEDSPKVLVEVPDDHLIKCCCQLKDKNKNVILLSNDNNLRVKSSAIGDILAVSDVWLIDLFEEDKKKISTNLHGFEIEPKDKMNTCGPNITFFMYTLTRHLGDFLFMVVCESFRKKYDRLWPLWLPDEKPSILSVFTKFDFLPLPVSCKKEFNENIWSFYREKKSYEELNAKDVDDFGRKCIYFSQNLNITDPGILAQFEQNMGFLKTGNIYENICGYFLASSTLAQNYFKMMEDKLKDYLNSLEGLIMKISSQTVVIPDSSIILKKLDKHLVVTNEATTVFLMLNCSKDIPLTCPELVIFHKVLLDFLEIVQENDRLPLLLPEDISNYVNQKREFLNPAAIEWLSDTRRKLSECKVFIRNL